MSGVVDITSEEYKNISVEVDDNTIKEDGYSANDCVIVRTTSGFPFHGIVQTPYHSGKVVTSGDSNILGSAIENRIRKEFSSDYNKRKQFNELVELKHRNLRPTTHFCMNGLVSNVEMNNFSGRDYVVFGEFSKQLDKNNIAAVQLEDVYFSDDVSISDILMTKEKYAEIKDDPKYQDTLDQLQVFVYDSSLLSQKEAVNRVLHILGKDAFSIGSTINRNFNYAKGIIDSRQPNKVSQMLKFIYDLSEGKIIPGVTFSRDSHMGSQFEAKENKLIFEESTEEDLNHMFYLIENSSIDSQEKEEIKEKVYLDISNKSFTGLEAVSRRLVSQMSVLEIVSLTQQFNEEFLKAVEDGTKMPTYYDTERVDRGSLIETMMMYDSYDEWDMEDDFSYEGELGVMLDDGVNESFSDIKPKVEKGK